MKTAIAILTLLIVTPLRNALASDAPQFTSCLNPQGEIKASYETGTHGIAGETGSFEGRDEVYIISDNSLTQCFCATNDSGVQTNWWKAEALSESDIASLKSQGWVYIPNGALWGLENAPYLAKNSDFSCKGPAGNGDKGNSVSSDSGGSNGDSSGGAGGNSGSGGGSGFPSGGIGSVLGLASTGNSLFLTIISAISALSLLLGLILKKRANKFSK